MNGFGDGKTSELRVEELGGSKQKGTGSCLCLGGGIHTESLLLRTERIYKADANIA